MDLAEFYDFRRKLVEALERDVLGPSSANEVLIDPPITRYVTGILFPRNEEVEPAEDDQPLEESSEDGVADPPVAMAHVRYPSSMGMTFAVDTRIARTIAIEVEAARYEEILAPETDDRIGAEAPRRRGRRRDAAAPSSWHRRPQSIAPITIDTTQPVTDRREALVDGLELFIRVRAADADGLVSITVVLINRLRAQAGLRDTQSFFQPRLRAAAPGDVAPFVERPRKRESVVDPDLRSYRLLYRHAAAIAVGHGCSVEWDVNTELTSRARSVWTSFVPRHEVRVADTNPEITGEILTLSVLASADQSRVISGLTAFCNGYKRWIAGIANTAKEFSDDLASIAGEHIANCHEAVARIEQGIGVLRTDDQAWKAFQLANRAMLQVRERTVAKQSNPAESPGRNSAPAWRPFQLAFMLLCLQGIAKADSDDRDVADLLWFPTGGGKTEAYLALIAFAVFLRRLRLRQNGGGVTALMRYTLRLLTIQQFERAALLICSCESIRRATSDLGDTPISIGLWVGRKGAPNTLKEARTALDKLRRGDRISLEEGNPMQLQSCPWCGTVLQPRHYYIAKNNPRLVVACGKEGCEFKNELPVYVVDEDIYNLCPTLIVATSDKFASLPWRENVARIFQSGANGRPPELIIQDELHLISGPLGTLAGLYETAIDLLCTHNGRRPKVIASTATIRRAGIQTASLFDRKVRQFPPPGIDARNSYFSVEAPREARGARLYVGLMAPGSSQTTLLVRAYAGLLQHAADPTTPPETRDPYWTLVGYFNSLRVLGGARMQVQDDVGDRMGLLATEGGARKREIDERVELTSREPSGDIPSHLQRMGIAHPSADALDVILATNMISVGVDVDRLGLMAVMGQPGSTSEYIQATSRVGRKFPGLVVTLYNASRSRDRSHYERFVAYHSALYRQVESTSVTPFSARARDRGLHAVFIALARLMIPALASRDSAALVEKHRAELDLIKKRILERVEHVAPREREATARQLDEILEGWVQRAQDVPDLVYDDQSHPDQSLLVDAASEVAVDGVFPTLWSLRDVDLSSKLYLVR